MNALRDNEREKQSTKRALTETKMDALTNVKVKMLLISKHYLKVAPTRTESNFNPLQPIAHSSVALTTR